MLIPTIIMGVLAVVFVFLAYQKGEGLLRRIKHRGRRSVGDVV